MTGRSAGLLALLLLAVGAPARAVTPASIQGRIGNGTSGAATPPGLVVTAFQVSAEGQEVESKQATAAADGTYRIDGFDLEKGTRFAVGADYLGVSYSRLLEAPGPEIQADLVVYEQTDDESIIAIDSDVVTIVGSPEELFEVIQLQRITNSSDRTFIGRTTDEGRQVLRIPVPEGATDLIPLDQGLAGGADSTVEGGVVSSAPLIPGNNSVSFGYKIRAPGGWKLSRRVFYETKQIDLLIASNIAFQSKQFRFQEEVTLDDRKYRRFRGGPFQAGDVLEAGVGESGRLPGPGLLWGLGGGLLVVLILGAGTFAVRRRSRPAPAISGDVRSDLVDRIAWLDEEFEKGRITENQYRQRRDRLKALLTNSSGEK